MSSMINSSSACLNRQSDRWSCARGWRCRVWMLGRKFVSKHSSHCSVRIYDFQLVKYYRNSGHAWNSRVDSPELQARLYTKYIKTTYQHIYWTQSLEELVGRLERRHVWAVRNLATLRVFHRTLLEARQFCKSRDRMNAVVFDEW